MVTPATTQQIDIDAHQRATITCPTCQKSATVNAAAYQSHAGTLRIKCPCGTTFSVALQAKEASQKQEASTESFSRAMVAQRVYVNAQDQGKIVCPSCQAMTMSDVSKLKDTHIPAKIKCACGHVFCIIVDSRNFYRKKTNLPGKYFNLEDDKAEDIFIENVSLSGIGFITRQKQALNVNEIIRIQFVLDDHIKIDVDKTATVKWVRGHFVGAMFNDMDAYAKEISHYLMPESP